MDSREFIEYINNNKFYSIKDLEDSEAFKYEDSPVLVDKEIGILGQYLWLKTKVYRCFDGCFVGVTGVDVIYSDMNVKDFNELCCAEEYTPIPTVKYVPKSSINAVSFKFLAPTQKQLDYIQTITNELGIEFKGKTKEEARQWLSINVPKYKEYLRDRQLEYDAVMQEIYDNYGDQI